MTLIFDLLILNSYSTPQGVMVKLCTKLERNRLICGWIIDDLVHFTVQFLWRDTFSGRFSGLRGPNLWGVETGKIVLRQKANSFKCGSITWHREVNDSSITSGRRRGRR